jgi:hypothetical protein
MLSMEFLGRSVVFHPSGDPPGAWAYTLDDEPVAELSWSRDEGVVRVEALGGVWRSRFEGRRVLGGLVESPDGRALLAYGGGLVTGLARSRRGASYVFFAQSDWRRGSWTGVDDSEGGEVIRAAGRLGPDGLWSEVVVTPDSRHMEDFWPLLILWGSLRVLGQDRPLIRMFSIRTSPKAASRALQGVLESLAF